jgi:hypothetical protein
LTNLGNRLPRHHTRFTRAFSQNCLNAFRVCSQLRLPVADRAEVRNQVVG